MCSGGVPTRTHSRPCKRKERTQTDNQRRDAQQHEDGNLTRARIAPVRRQATMFSGVVVRCSLLSLFVYPRPGPRFLVSSKEACSLALYYALRYAHTCFSVCESSWFCIKNRCCPPERDSQLHDFAVHGQSSSPPSKLSPLSSYIHTHSHSPASFTCTFL